MSRWPPAGRNGLHLPGLENFETQDAFLLKAILGIFLDSSFVGLIYTGFTKLLIEK